VQSSQTTHDKWLLRVRASVFDAYLAYWDAVPGRSQVYRLLGNVLLDRLFGAEIRILPDLEDTTPILDSIASELTQQGLRPYVIPLGGSNGLGAAAYAAAFLELRRLLHRSGCHEA
jgi:1-aminocyclopropane-1-carboxylate deaminase/D-cysteine desulfhydrase-like pyridoxal-dependent ACC family enzyme